MCAWYRDSAYKLPLVKIAHVLILRLVGICSLAIAGTRSIKVNASIMMLSIESVMYSVN